MGIPHLLVAPKRHIGPQLPADFRREDAEDGDEDEPEYDGHDRSIYSNGIGDPRGFYEDGAYTARPFTEEEEGEEDENDESAESDGRASAKTIHEAYFASILNQYLLMRDVLHSKPPGAAISGLTKSHPSEVNTTSRKSSPIPYWTRLLRTTDPHPVQVALMPKDSVLRLLRMILGGKFLRRGFPIPERTSRWLWALLARMPARDELNYSEIGWIRDLGRRAVLLGSSLAQMAALREELEDGGLGVHEDVEESDSDDDDDVGISDEEGNEGIDASEDGDSQSMSEAAGQELVSHDAGPQDVSQGHVEEEPEVPGTSAAPNHSDDEEEGEVDDDGSDDGSDVAMDISSDEEGEVAENLEDAKARLLAQLDHNEAEEANSAKREAEEQEARYRERINMRATLNMILTVAGEYYGQRDLLEFREPFVGM